MNKSQLADKFKSTCTCKLQLEDRFSEQAISDLLMVTCRALTVPCCMVPTEWLPDRRGDRQWQWQRFLRRRHSRPGTLESRVARLGQRRDQLIAAAHYHSAEDTGIHICAYYFGRPQTESNAVAQARPQWLSCAPHRASRRTCTSETPISRAMRTRPTQTRLRVVATN